VLPMTRALLVCLIFVGACSKSGGRGGGPSQPNQPALEPLTGVWQGPVDFGSRTATLRLAITEDAGVVAGWKYVNDPSDPSEFHLVQMFTGTRAGDSVSLVTPTETITAALDGGVLVGVDPITQPTELLDAGQAPVVVNVSFSMNRITRTVIPPDAGDYR
jgi:hypothetical protein